MVKTMDSAAKASIYGVQQLQEPYAPIVPRCCSSEPIQRMLGLGLAGLLIQPVFYM